MPLPNYIYKQVFGPYGGRLPKRKLWLPPIKKWEPSNSIYPFKGYKSKPVNNGDFRYFWCSHVASGWAMCKVCKIVLWSDGDRVKHLVERGCGKIACNAYKILLRDKKCVACDAQTERTHWGLPLCSEACDEIWKHEERHDWKALTEACRLAGYTDD